MDADLNRGCSEIFERAPGKVQLGRVSSTLCLRRSESKPAIVPAIVDAMSESSPANPTTKGAIGAILLGDEEEASAAGAIPRMPAVVESSV